MSKTDYTVKLTNSAQKEIKSLDNVIMRRALEAVRALHVNPRPAGCRKIVGAGQLWRIRVGDYRIIYRVSDAEHIVEVIAVRHRSKAYE